jgi:hypothetical protein
METWGHESTILHSRDIRKAQGDFAFRRDPGRRPAFYERLNQLMGESEYQLIASVIPKLEHRERYGVRAQNPYDQRGLSRSPTSSLIAYATSYPSSRSLVRKRVSLLAGTTTVSPSKSVPSKGPAGCQWT